MKKQCKRTAALLLAAVLLLGLSACQTVPDASEPVSGTSAAEAATTTTAPTTGTTEPERTTPPDIPAVEGDDPLRDRMYTPDPSEVTFSTDPVIPGEAEVQVGTHYTGPTIAFRRSDDDPASFGLWIWDCRVITDSLPNSDLTVDILFDMMLQNRITDVYIHLGRLADLESLVYYAENGEEVPDDVVTEMQMRGFIKKCYRYGIRVEALVDGAGAGAGRYFGFDGSNTYTSAKIYLAYIASFNERGADESERFRGIQYDVEPDWSGFDGRAANVQYMANFFTYMRRLFDAYDLEMDFCINAWTKETDMVVDEDGYRVNLLDVLTRKCHSLTIMAYRPAAKDQYSISSLELEYGKKNGCRIIVGSETMPPDRLSAGERNITYYTRGAAVMSKQQTLLRDMLSDFGYDNVGGAIHHAETFYQMMCEKP